MRCPGCRNQLRTGAKFCPVCGRAVAQRQRAHLPSVLLATTLLLGAAVIGSMIGVILTDAAREDKPVITLFSEETIPWAKGTDEAVHGDAESKAQEANFFEDAESDGNIPDQGGADSAAMKETSVVPSRPGKLSEEQLRKISAELGVPENLDTQITQGEPAYWEAGSMYRTPVEIYHDGKLIAGASVESFTGGLAGAVLTYSEPAETLPQTAEEKRAVRGYVSNAEGGLNVRENPSTSSRSVRRIYNGEPVVITEQLVAEGLHWGHISGGWICTNYVTFEEDALLDDFSDDASGKYYMVSPSAGLVNVRSGAGTSYQSLRRIPGGEELVIYDQTDAEGRTWGKTDVGWVCMDYLIPSDFETDINWGDEDFDFPADDGDTDDSGVNEESGSLDDFWG